MPLVAKPVAQTYLRSVFATFLSETLTLSMIDGMGSEVAPFGSWCHNIYDISVKVGLLSLTESIKEVEVLTEMVSVEKWLHFFLCLNKPSLTRPDRAAKGH